MTRRSLARLVVLTAGVVAAVGTLPGRASAQQLDSLRSRYLIHLPPTLPIMSTSGRAAPGSSSSTPTAFGPNWGDGFIGFGYQGAVRTETFDGHTSRTRPDGAAVLGIGLGNSRDAVGIEVSYTSYSTIRSGFGEVGAISAKLHRVLPGNWGIALGMENAFNVGGAGDHGVSLYGVVSKVWPQSSLNPFQKVTASVGLGSGRFRTIEQIQNGDWVTVNPFGSIGIQLFEPLSVLADWNGQSLALGGSIVPFRGLPLIITPSVADVAGDHVGDPRFILGVGLGIDFAHLPVLFP